MTQTKAFFVGFISPAFVLGLTFLFFTTLRNPEEYEILGRLLQVFLLFVPLLIFSFFLPSFLIGLSGHKEFRKHGYYGVFSFILILFLTTVISNILVS